MQINNNSLTDGSHEYNRKLGIEAIGAITTGVGQIQFEKYAKNILTNVVSLFLVDIFDRARCSKSDGLPNAP